jgi:hypothetical protein
MTQKGRAIQLRQSVVTDLISHLASLPEREKSSDDPISLPEIFRTKEYMAEIRGALKKGYTFEDLAEIFTERCGVGVSARQLKYHYTRGKNRSMKTQAGKKAKNAGDQKKCTSSANPPQKDTVERPSNGLEIASGSGATTCVKAVAFSIDMEPEEI